jgi:excisionase family DNA binding protein
MLNVTEAARRAGRNPETVRQWIRSGKLPARKIGNRYVIEEHDLVVLMTAKPVPLPERWRRSHSGRPMPDAAAAITLSRRGR